ncbi:alpha/beta fold hydrolase [Paenibacillus gansuensis]|uniref:Alpha/beta fold hydrolase n=1 Tax=Paenibacillus gansuensis TaxID=306542 RepID=A0ABW5PL05_9BACL
MEVKRVKVQDQLELAYVEEGQGEPVLLLHGFCGSSRYFEKFIPLLSGDYRIIAPDLRGHGQSSVPQGPYAIEAMAADIRGLMEALNIEKAHLLGHSLGGYITLAFAEAYPELLNSFGLIHSTGYPDTEEGKAARGKAIEAIRRDGMAPFMDGLAPKLFASSHRAARLDALEETKRIGTETDPEGAASTAAAMRDRPDRTAVIAETPMPVLLVAGGEDAVIPPEKTFSATGHRITQARLESAGHMSMMETPRQLAAVVREFLRSV